MHSLSLTAQEVQRILDAHHVQWIATEENYDTTTANGRLHLNIKLSITQDESDRTSERIKFVFDNKVKRGGVISGKVPLGYKIENKRLAIDPQTAPIAQDIFQQYTVIRSVRALREYVLNKYGLTYAQTGIRALLDNERYIDRAHGQDDFCPPLISPEQFQQVQKLLAQRAQRNLARLDRVYLFTGLVRCAECGNSLSAHVVGQKYTYYRCTKYEQLHLCPHKKRTSELVLE
ncbi:MAG: recombinase zinc beta ribbon domain-containing protein [Oscillospiraceae bacterium]|nr:recombinase zinc beta ribbon domain-containing protein [Oscillospiraceae bacterium]